LETSDQSGIGWLILFAGAFAAGNLVLRAAGLREIASLPLLARGLVFASLFCVPWTVMSLSRHSVPLKGYLIGLLFFVALTATVIPFWLQLEGFRRTTATKGGIILSSIPVLTTIASRLLLKRRPTADLLIQLAGMTAGGVLISMEGNLRGVNAGDWMILGAAACFAVSMVVAHRLIQEWPAVVVIQGRLLIGALVIYPTARMLSPAAAWSHPDLGAFSVIFGGLMFLFIMGIYRGMEGLGPEYATLFDIVAAGLTALGGWVFWSEQLTGVQWLGAGLILLLGIRMIVAPPTMPTDAEPVGE
jgi:drug/metabolite transporter (DMT)-like permease